MSKYNLAIRHIDERRKIDVDLAASGVACKERLNQPVIIADVENTIPEDLKKYFRQRLEFYRLQSKNFPSGNNPVYMKEKR